MDVLITDREAPHSMIQWFASRALDANSQPAPWFPGMNRACRVLCRCSSNSCQCFKVISVRTVRQSLQQQGRVDPFKCPCCELTGCYSPLHCVFRDSISEWFEGLIVWEWGDCPGGGNRMHWDATLPMDDRAFRFEIDGGYHARHTPLATDVKKNDIIDTYDTCLLRMQEDDNQDWGRMAKAYVRRANKGVYYTSSYDAFRNQTDRRRHVVVIHEALGEYLIE